MQGYGPPLARPREKVKRMRTSTSAFVPSAVNTLAPAHMSHPMARCSRQPVIAMRCSADDVDQQISIDGRRPLSSPQQSSRRGALKGIITAAILAMGMPLQASMADEGACKSGDASCSASGSGGIPTMKLGSLEVSRVIQGHWQLAGGHGPVDEKQAVENMKVLYDAGQTTLDTADIYGPSEGIIGKFLKERPGAVVCTKFCCFNGLDRISKEEVRRKITASCKRLGVKQLDLVAFFWLDLNVKRYVQVAKWLSELRDEGLIKEIGVTNFDTTSLKDMVDAGVPIVSNQVQYSIVDRRAQHGLAAYCQSKGIKLLTYGSVGGGLFSEKYLGAKPPTRRELDTSSLAMYTGSIRRFGSWELFQELLTAMADVGKKHGVSVATVAERYVLQQESVGAAIIGVRNTKHIKESLDAFGFELDAEDVKKLEGVLSKSEGPIGDIYGYERGLV